MQSWLSFFVLLIFLLMLVLIVQVAGLRSDVVRLEDEMSNKADMDTLTTGLAIFTGKKGETS